MHSFTPFYARLPAIGCGFFYQEERRWLKIDTRAVTMLSGAREIGGVMMFVITELNKQTGETTTIARFDNEDDAHNFWRQIAFENIDHAHLWHRLERDEDAA